MDPYPPDFPIKRHYLEIDDRKIHYLDQGEGELTLLMLHGNPSSAYLYRKLIEPLSQTYRCVAPDLLGFGASDKPSQIDFYTFERHLEMVENLVKHLELNNLVLIAQDWGGPIGFGALVRDVQRYRGFVAMNTMTKPIVTIPLLFNFAFRGPFSKKLLLNGYFQKTAFEKGVVNKLDEKDLQVYFAANNSPETRAGIAAFPKMIPTNKQHENHSIFLQVFSKLESIDLPSLVMFSDKDPVFKQEEGQEFASRLARSKFIPIKNAGHFLQEDNPEDLIDNLKPFLSNLSSD